MRLFTLIAALAATLAAPASAQSISVYGGGQPAGTVVATPPAGLGHVPPFVITRRPDGMYRHTFDVTTRQPVATVFAYAGPGGDNTANCTSWSTRCRSLWQAAQKLKTLIGATATVGALRAQIGQYLATNVDGGGIADDLGSGSAFFSRSLVIEPVDASGNVLPAADGRTSLASQIVSIHNIALPSFTATADPTVFVGTYITQTPAQAAWDASRTNGFGRPLGITNLPLSAVPDVSNPVAQLQALHAAFGKGAFFLDTAAKKIWLRLSDGRAPDANVFVSKTGDSLYLSPAYGFAQTAYIRNLDVWGGFIRSYASKTGQGGQTLAVTTSDSYVGYVGVANIAFNWQHSGSAVHVRDVASDTYLDAFAYQLAPDDTGAGSGLLWYELDSSAEYVGNDNVNDTSTNASTTHRATTGIRVNDRYAFVSNRIIHDIQSAKTWSLGITAGPSTRASQAASGYTVALTDRALKSSVAVASGYYDNTGTPESAQAWIDGLTIVGPVTSVLGAYNNPGDGGPGGTIYYRNVTAIDAASRMIVSPYAGQSQTGTIQPY